MRLKEQQAKALCTLLSPIHSSTLKAHMAMLAALTSIRQTIANTNNSIMVRRLNLKELLWVHLGILLDQVEQISR
jgi:hypothetical protein